MSRVFTSLFVLTLAFTYCAANSKAEDKAVKLTPTNTKIQFVGNHTGDDPKPRKGGFKEFSGTATVDGKALKAIKVEIDTKSLYTEIDKLTGHLKSPDFFDVNENPKATFESSSIEAGKDGKVKITGKLTLLKKTESISFPATVDVSDGIKLSAAFKIDRTKFGMTFGEKQVEKDVEMTVSVGK